MTKEEKIKEVMELVNLVEGMTTQYMMVVEQGDNPFDEDMMLKELKATIQSKLRELIQEGENNA